MLDLKWVLKNPDQAKKALQDRCVQVDLDGLVQLDQKRKELQAQFDSLRALQNEKSKEIAKLKSQGKDAGTVIDEMQKVAQTVKEAGQGQARVEQEINTILLNLPNLPHSSVPKGNSAGKNKFIRSWGGVPKFLFKPRPHWELGEKLGLLDFDRAAKMAGARFAVYRGALARLERVLIDFMIGVHTKDHGYEEILPPFMANAEALTGTGQLPKFEEDLFKTTTGYYLIPTAEVPLANFYRGEILKDADLPKNFCAYTPCFRSEAGSYGKDVRGLIRQHQFNKVELVKFTRPESSYDELEALTQHAEKILQLLKLPYRIMLLCTGDMGFASAKTYDVEVWLAGQNAYREISSCSNCGDFQARRMQTRFKDQNGKLQYVHTLNGSGLAVGRTVIAIMENYQQEDGSIIVPEVLREKMGVVVIGKD